MLTYYFFGTSLGLSSLPKEPSKARKNLIKTFGQTSTNPADAVINRGIVANQTRDSVR
jgi:hypothetical protein